MTTNVIIAGDNSLLEIVIVERSGKPSNRLDKMDVGKFWEALDELTGGVLEGDQRVPFLLVLKLQKSAQPVSKKRACVSEGRMKSLLTLLHGESRTAVRS